MTGASDSDFDAVVIGAGPNGLSAAVTLAERGHSVRVLEAMDTIGGGARTAELTLPGFRNDVCSAIHPLGAASSCFNGWPLAEHGLQWVHPDIALAHPLDDDEAAVLNRSIDETVESFDDAHDRHAYRALMAPIVERWDDLAADILAPPHVPRHPLLLARFARVALPSAMSLATRRFRGERARALLAGLCAHSVLPLQWRPSASFGLVLGALAHVAGWPSPRGGSQHISDALASLLRAHGGVIETNRHVKAMNDLPRARTYMFDTSPSALCDIAGDALPARYRGKLMRYRHGPGSFKVDWALAEPIPWTSAHCRRAGCVHVGGTLEEIAASERAPWNDEHAARPFVLVGQQSLFDRSRVPREKGPVPFFGPQTAWGYCHVPRGSARDMTEAIESQIERFAPGFRDCILARHVMNCAALEAHNPNLIGGDISGGAHTLRQIIGRPVLGGCPYATPNRSIYLCSSSTPPGGGVHGLCGHHAAAAAIRRARK